MKKARQWRAFWIERYKARLVLVIVPDLVHLVAYLVANVPCGICDAFANIVRGVFCLCFGCGVIMDRACCIFGVSPGLFRCALYLIGYA
jgi:hypothetical protein